MVTMSIPASLHSMADYRLMFDLSDQDLQHSILEYPGGVSCFNTQMYQAGYSNVVSADASYCLLPIDMLKHTEFLLQKIAEKVDAVNETLALFNTSRELVKQFLADYSAGVRDGRYIAAVMPKLPFNDHQFTLALSSSKVFGETINTACDTIAELSRVAQEVRIFSLLDKQDQAANFGPILLALQEQNFGVEIKKIPYQSDQHSNVMLRVWAKHCVVS